MSSTNGQLAGVIDDIYQRLQRLENARPPANEVTSANYLSVDAQGNVSANFSGLIHALGIVLPASTLTASPSSPANAIAWERQADGAFAASIWAGGTNAAGEDVLQLNSSGIEAEAGNAAISALILNANTSGNSYAGLGVYAGAISGHSELLLVLKSAAGVVTDTVIMDDAANSAFAQVPGGASQVYVGAPAIVGGQANASYGPGTGEPIASLGAQVIADPNGRINGAGQYTTPAAGFFLASCVCSFSLGSSASCVIGAHNVDTGALVVSERIIPGTLFECMTMTALVQATAAGQRIAMLFSVNVNATIQRLDTINGAYATHLTVLEVT
jgi:hypothetical protein